MRIYIARDRTASSALWRQHVRNRAARDDAQLRFNRAIDLDRVRLSHAIDWEREESIKKLLREARQATCEPSTPRSLWNGSLQEQAWLSLHEAEAELDGALGDAELGAQARDLLAKAEGLLKPGDKRVKAVSDALAEPTRAAHPGPLTPVTVAHLSRAVYDAMDRRFVENRACRHRMIRLTLMSLVALGVVMAAFATNAIPLKVGGATATATATAPPPLALKVALLVPLFGAIGALITAIPPLAKVTGAAYPFGLQLYQMLLKVTLGPVFAIVGMMLLQSGFFPSVKLPMPLPDLLAWALVFGATQHVVTRAIDSRVADLVFDER